MGPQCRFISTVIHIVIYLVISLPLDGIGQSRDEFLKGHIRFFQKLIQTGNTAKLQEILKKEDVKDYKIQIIDNSGSGQTVNWIEYPNEFNRKSTRFNLNKIGFEFVESVNTAEISGDKSNLVDIYRYCDAKIVLQLTYETHPQSVKHKMFLSTKNELFNTCNNKDKSIKTGWTLGFPPKVDDSNRENGLIEMELTIDKEGKVHEGRIINSSVNEEISKKYLDSFKKAKFKPVNSDVRSYSIRYHNKTIKIVFKELQE